MGWVLIVQLTDTHVLAPDVGLRAGIDHNARLREAIASINAEHPVPDLILATGDMTNDGEPAELAELVSLLDGLERPLAILPGNHDDQAAFRAAFDMDWADADHLSWIVDVGEVALIGLDCTVPGRGHGRFDAARAAWFGEALAATEGRPTLVALHHPPFRSGIEMMDGLMLHDAEAFTAAVTAAPHVNRVVCGHLHRPATAVLQGPKRSVVASTCLSTVLHPALDLDGVREFRMIDDPVGYQLHRYDADEWLTHTRYIGTGREAFAPVSYHE